MLSHYLKDDFDGVARFVDDKMAEGRSFCLFRLPGDADGTLWVVFDLFADDDKHRPTARVRPWQQPNWIDFSTLEDRAVPRMEVCPESTPKEYYLGSISSLTQELAERGGKTVICRNICGTFDKFSLWPIVRRYFDETYGNGALTFLFRHPSTGFWMGSTPELILERTMRRAFHTIALAGTRRAGELGPWDDKNIEEHRLVADDIERRLRGLGFDFSRSDMRELAYGRIEHLCTDFESGIVEDYSRERFDAVVDELEPTPAVAGFPREEALAEIEKYELWPRHCYGGCLNIADVRVNMTYGILRCVHFDDKRWAVYTGSGITALSNPEAEWAETEAKAAPLLNVLGV